MSPGDFSMTSYVTKNRALLEAIQNSCKKHGIACKMFSDDWIIQLQKGRREHFIYAYGFDCNSQASAAIATDKVATYQLLADRAIAAVPHFLLTSAAQPDIDPATLDGLLKEYGSLVVKPVQGSRGESVARFNDADSILAFTAENSVAAWAASPFIEVQREIRLVVFDGSVRLGYEKHNPTVVNELKLFNLNLGTTAEAIVVSKLSRAIQDLAVQSMEAIGLRLGAVDLVFDPDGDVSVLEINSGFSLEHFALMSPQNRKQVVEFYETVVERLFR
jgi:glutathione synthase/RimK-type ligase-like ATP-grasp enzyme